MLATLVALCCLSSPASVAEEPFAALELEAALEKAKSEQKLLLVDFTATWCGPCKKMEKDTWGAAEVRTWLGENALAIQVDVDRSPALARRFGIEAMPTVVALRDGADFDRVVGYRDAAQFLSWARDVRAGKRSSDALLERSKSLRTSSDVDARHEVARELLRAKQYDEALAHYLWLWPATREATGYGGVRTSFMLADMAELAQKHEPAKKAFALLFEELQARIDAAPVPTYGDWQEWTAFCNYFDGRARLVVWYEKRRDEQGRLLAGNEEFIAELVVGDVFDALLREDRARDAARLYSDARPRAERLVGHYRDIAAAQSSLDEEVREGVAEHGRRRLADDLAKLFAAMQVAARPEEATAVAELLLATLDTPESRIALVRAGVELAKQPDPRFGPWLDEAEAAGGNVKTLRKKLARLEKKSGGD